MYLLFLVIVLLCCLSGYYVHVNYHVNEKLMKGSVRSEDLIRESMSHVVTLEMGGKEGVVHRQSESSVTMEEKHHQHVRKVFSDPHNFLFDLFTCACCYEEFE